MSCTFELICSNLIYLYQFTNIFFFFAKTISIKDKLSIAKAKRLLSVPFEC